MPHQPDITMMQERPVDGGHAPLEARLAAASETYAATSQPSASDIPQPSRDSIGTADHPAGSDVMRITLSSQPNTPQRNVHPDLRSRARGLMSPTTCGVVSPSRVAEDASQDQSSVPWADARRRCLVRPRWKTRRRRARGVRCDGKSRK